MRKHQQRQILDLLRTIEEAQDGAFYADCQDGALVIGEFIEGIEGEGTQTVTLLEEYCDMLFKASTGELGKKALSKQLVKIQNSVKTELKPDRLEVIFLPYQLCMFDSLESIYLAAKNDPGCDAYVIPIPYFNVLPGEILGDMHYDGDKYPANIPVTDWREYDIEKRHPDIIFTHYPYDDLAGNVRIHPDFYSVRLREYCQMLVCVPYFITVGGVQNFNSFLPGVIHAHKVIVWSDVARQSFIKHYKMHDNERNWKGQYGKAEEKFITLGSPKIDKVINSKPEDFQIPDEWRRLIYKPDGTKKTVVLLNTHMFAWINNCEKYFIKIRYIFDIFRDRDDILLWWRPHPSTVLNFQTYLPEYADELIILIDDYKNDGWGIYDDTTDLHRAIACTDAYYGDRSSLVALYAVTGKPVMIGNPDILHDEVKFEPNRIYADEKYLWFTMRRINALCKMSRNDWKVELAGSFPGEENYIPQYNNSLYRDPVEKDGILYFPPLLAKEIAAYSLIDNTFKKFPYACCDYGSDIPFAFIAAFSYGKYVFFIPFSYPAIIRLDTGTGEAEYFTDWVEKIAVYVPCKQKQYASLPIVSGKTVCITLLGTNIVVIFDMETCLSTVYEVGQKSYRYNTIRFDGENFWLSPHFKTNTPLVKWNPDKGVIKEIKLKNVCSNDAKIRTFYCDGHIWLYPMIGNNAYKVNCSTDELSAADSIELKAGVIAAVYGDNLYVFNYESENLLQYNYKTAECKEELIRYPKDIYPQLNKLLYGAFSKDPKKIKTINDYLYIESSHIRLRGFLTYITDTNTINEDSIKICRTSAAQMLSNNAGGNSGQAIYDYIKLYVL